MNPDDLLDLDFDALKQNLPNHLRDGIALTITHTNEAAAEPGIAIRAELRFAAYQFITDETLDNMPNPDAFLEDIVGAVALKLDHTIDQRHDDPRTRLVWYCGTSGQTYNRDELDTMSDLYKQNAHDNADRGACFPDMPCTRSGRHFGAPCGWRTLGYYIYHDDDQPEPSNDLRGALLDQVRQCAHQFETTFAAILARLDDAEDADPTPPHGTERRRICPNCGGSGTIRRGIVGILDQTCERCRGLGFLRDDDPGPPPGLPT